MDSPACDRKSRIMHGIGHNKGPTMERGAAWRRHCWQASRQALLPKLPLPVLKRRLKRALDLGLAYPAYASVRAATGRDIIALLFSQNALRLNKDLQLSEDRQTRLSAVVQSEILIARQSAHSELNLAAALQSQGIKVTRIGDAPRFIEAEPQARAALAQIRGQVPGDAVLLIGETAFERSWCATGKLAGFLPAERYFPNG